MNAPRLREHTAQASGGRTAPQLATLYFALRIGRERLLIGFSKELVRLSWCLGATTRFANQNAGTVGFNALLAVSLAAG